MTAIEITDTQAAGRGAGGPAPTRRVELARQVLRAAEAKAGVVGLAERIAERRPGRPGRLAVADAAGRAGEATRLGGVAGAAPDGLVSIAELAARVALRAVPGSTVSVQGSTQAVWAIAAALWGPDTWGALVGLPDAGLLAAAQAGIALERVIVVPELGAQPLKTLAGLVDSYGVVVLGLAGSISAADRRRIEARVRQRHMDLVVAGAWIEVTVERSVYGGIGQGEGHLAPPLVAARVTSRTAALWQAAAV